MDDIVALADSIKCGVEELAEENERLRSVVSALESYMKDRGETCWITVCERMEEYRKWRRENG